MTPEIQGVGKSKTLTISGDPTAGLNVKNNFYNTSGHLDGTGDYLTYLTPLELT